MDILNKIFGGHTETPTEEVARLRIEEAATAQLEQEAKSTYDLKREAEKLRKSISVHTSETRRLQKASESLNPGTKQYKMLLLGAAFLIFVLLLLLLGQCGVKPA